MPNLNYAEQWGPELLAILIQGTLTSPFITNNVRWLDAKTFHFTQMSVSGYKNHKRSGGWNTGEYNQKDVPYTVTHDRDVQFMVDKADVDETNQTASIQNISHIFEQTQVVPETDALFFSKVAQAAQKTELYHTETASTEYTSENVFAKLKHILAAGKLRRYKANGSLIMYVSSDIMDKLEVSKEFTRKIEMTQIAEGGLGIETRVTDIDGVTLMEVVDDERFYDRFDWDVAEGGFAPLKSKYTITTDTDVVEGKTYYTKSDSAYLQNVSNIFGDVKQIFGGLIDFIAGVFSGDWSRAWNGIVDAFGGIFSLIADIAKGPINMVIGLINGMLDGLESGINWMVRKVNGLSFDVPDWVPVIGGDHFGFDLPEVGFGSIPYLAEGGYVKPNTPQLAMIGDNRHQGEVVAPEDKLIDMAQKAAAMASSAELLSEAISILKQILKVLETLDLDIQLDGKSLKKYVVDKINEHTKQTGKCEIIT